VALQYRTIRAAASALILAVAVGAGGMTGMTGMTSTLAAEATIPVTGTLVDGAGAPLAGVDLLLTEELAPDGGIAAFHATTAADGSFTAALYPWGTAQVPATLTIVTAPDQQITVIGEECSQTWSVVASAKHDLAIGEAGAGVPEALTLTATTELVGEVCAVSATPPPGNAAGGADLTPPPTDLALGPAAATPDRLGIALLIGFAVGLTLVLAFFSPRPGARRP
jgi:hypothetical protein